MTRTSPTQETLDEESEAAAPAKSTVEVELIMSDGTSISGRVYRWANQRVLDLLNDPRPFFAVRLETEEVILVSKTSVAICKPIDRAS